MRGREVCSAKAHSRAIDSGDGGRALLRGFGGKPEGPPCRRRNVEAPMRFAPQTTRPLHSRGSESGNHLNFRHFRSL